MNYKEYEKNLLTFDKKLFKHAEKFTSQLNESQMMAIQGHIKSTIDCYNFKTKYDEMMLLMDSCFSMLNNMKDLVIVDKKTNHEQVYIENVKISSHKPLKDLSIYTGSVPSNMFNITFKDKDKTDIKIWYFWSDLKIAHIWGQKIDSHSKIGSNAILSDKGKAYFLNMLIEKELNLNPELRDSLITKMKNAYSLLNIFKEVLKSPSLKLNSDKFVSNLVAGGFDKWNIDQDFLPRLNELKDFLLMTSDSNYLKNSDFYNNLERTKLLGYKNA